MDLFNTLAAKVSEVTVAPIVRQFGYVFSYRTNMDKLKDQVEKLQAKRDDVERQVKVAQENCQEIAYVVQLWSRNVGEIILGAREFLDKYSHVNTRCFCKYCPNLCLQVQISRKARRMTAEIHEIGAWKFESISYENPPTYVGLSSVGEEVFGSRISVMNQIMEALADPAVDMIGLYGLGGVGKSTLVRQVAMKALEEKLFHKVVLVVVNHYRIEEIQNQIADSVGLRFGMEIETELSTRASYLRQRLIQEKSLLVILDDLWERLDYEEVGIPVTGEGNQQCKIILISRSDHLTTCNRNFKLELLSEEEAWMLFKEMAGINDDCDPDLMSVADSVCRNCSGLPVAIVTIAKALRKKSLAEWRDALRPLGSSTPHFPGPVYSSIKFSYDYLETVNLKSILLLSAMFSQPPSIADLFIFSVGLGLFDGVHNLEEARDQLSALVQKLKASSLLLDNDSEDALKMNHVVRDVVLSIAFKEWHALVKTLEGVHEWPGKDLLESCIAICLDSCGSSELPEKLYAPKVEFFSLNNSNDHKLIIPEIFFEGMQELKVLNLKKMDFSLLPVPIRFPEKLRTLSLCSCRLEDINVVGHLKKLKILNLSFSTIEKLPCEVGQLSFLQMLNLNRCSDLKVIPPGILSNLKKLEELYMEGSFNQWEGTERASLAELKQLQSLSTLEIDICDASVLPKDLFSQDLLTRYRISIGTPLVRSSNHEISRTLTLNLNNNIDMEYGFFRLLDSVQDLYLENLNGIESFCQAQITARTFCKLRAIKVKCCGQLKSLFSVSMAETLSRLEEMEVSDCNSMEEIVAFVDQEIAERGSTRSVLEFPQLRSLTLKCLPALTGFYFGEDTTLSDTQFNARMGKQKRNARPLFSSKVAFPKLEILRLHSINFLNIWEMPSSTSSETQTSEIVESSQTRIIWDDQLPDRSFNNLKILEVEKCDSLLKLIPSYLLKSLRNLEELRISSCDSLEAVFNFEELDNNNEKQAFCLKKFDLCDVPKLKTVWGLENILRDS